MGWVKIILPWRALRREPAYFRKIMDWQERLISLFLSIDKYYKNELFLYTERLSNNNDPKFSDIEVITIYLWGIMAGHKKITSIYDYTRDHLSDWFPKIPSYPTYTQRLNRINAIFPPLLSCIQSDFHLLSESQLIRLIDSMPITIAKAQRSGSAKVARGIANKGYNSTKKTYYYGVKLHIMAFRRSMRLPLPDYIGLTPASEADINVLKAIADDIYNTPVYADKAYIDSILDQNLAEQGAELCTPVKKKKGQKYLTIFEDALSTIVSQVRQPIESLFSWIEEKTGIQTASKVRSVQGLFVHVFGRLAAAMFMLTPTFNS